jgi:hypothetical protein
LTRTLFDSIINKTPLAARTNRSIGGRAPSEYLRSLAKPADASEDALESNLRTHRINPEHLKADDFSLFAEFRSRELLGLIERAMGKIASNAPSTAESLEEPSLDEELDDE